MLRMELAGKRESYESVFRMAFIVFAIFCFFPPACIEVLVPWLDEIIDICRLFLIVGAIAVCVKDRGISKIILLIIAYYGLLMASTILNSGDLWEAISQASSAIGVSIFNELCLRRDVESFLKSVVIVFSFLCTVNLITVILFRDGLYTSRDFYFLGNYNTHIYYILPLLMCVLLCWEEKIHFGIKILLIVFCSISFVSCHSVSSMITMSVFSVLVLIREIISKKGKWLFQKVTGFYVLYIVGSLEIVVVRIHRFFSYIIENIFHKNMTLTGRTPMWDKALAHLSDKPILGFGSQTRDYMIDLIGKRHCHNLLLQILFQTGIIGLFVFASLLLNVSRVLSKSHFLRCKSIIVITIFCFLVMYLTELASIATFLWILVIAVHIEDIGSALERQKGDYEK